MLMFCPVSDELPRKLSATTTRVLQSMPELIRSPAFKSFRKYVSHRLRSEDGRFFRIHFRMSESQKEKIQKAFGNRPWKGLQVAPAGSLAYRVEVRGKDRASTGPELDRLSKEFFDGRKPGFVPKERKLS